MADSRYAVKQNRLLVGALIKKYRKQAKLSQRQLAEAVILLLKQTDKLNNFPDKAAISRIESGFRELKLVEILVIAKILKIDHQILINPLIKLVESL